MAGPPGRAGDAGRLPLRVALDVLAKAAGLTRQVAVEFLGGDALLRLSKRHDISRNLVRIRVKLTFGGRSSEGRQITKSVLALEIIAKPR